MARPVLVFYTILVCTHFAALAIGIWWGEHSLRAYKKKLYRTLYSGHGFKHHGIIKRVSL